jgi:4,5-dihydroxyphthalate decarboxylase
VRPEEISWVMGRRPDRSHGSTTGFEPPAGIDLSYAPEGAQLSDLLAHGDLDAALLYIEPRGSVTRDGGDAAMDQRVRPLFPDAVAEGARYFQATGIYPMNHTVVIRRSLVDRHPWLPTNLFGGFLQAKKVAEARLKALARHYIQVGALVDLGPDPTPYGVAANRLALETALEYSYEQGLTGRRIALEELFDAGTLDLVDIST